MVCSPRVFSGSFTSYPTASSSWFSASDFSTKTVDADRGNLRKESWSRLDEELDCWAGCEEGDVPWDISCGGDKPADADGKPDNVEECGSGTLEGDTTTRGEPRDVRATLRDRADLLKCPHLGQRYSLAKWVPEYKMINKKRQKK